MLLATTHPLYTWDVLEAPVPHEGESLGAGVAGVVIVLFLVLFRLN